MLSESTLLSITTVLPTQTSYLHPVGRAGRFGTKGLTFTLVSSESDQQVMAAIQSRLEVAVPELPEHIDPASYSDFKLACGILDSSWFSVTS